MSSYLGGGVISLDRWEGLKEWHRRHQDLLGGHSSGSNSEGPRSQSQSSIFTLLSESSQSNSDPLQNVLQNPNKSEAGDIFLPSSDKHDLSIIPEADEDSRSRDGVEIGFPKFKQSVPQSVNPAQKANLNKQSGIGSETIKSSKGNVPAASLQDSAQQKLGNAVVKRPFLRRGQGLAKYNLKPEDLKNPYKKGSANNASSRKKIDQPKSSNFAERHHTVKQAAGRHQWNASQELKTSSLALPMQRLVLSIPSQKTQNVEIGTWSQVLSGDAKTSDETVSDHSSRQSVGNPIPKQDMLLTPSIPRQSRAGNFASPTRKRNGIGKADSSPEEDQESLAAYLDLEQHVGNASFCSTSSKVDRLVAKSSKPTIHQSNPDTITQSKELTPVKTGRKFTVSERASSSTSEKPPGMWSTTDIENLLRARAHRSGPLVNPHPEPIRNDIPAKPSAAEQLISMESKEDIPVIQNKSLKARQEDIDWMLEELGPVRKPHLMKTMSSIDLDSSLIRNALAPTTSHDRSESESESSTSEDTSEEEDDMALAGNGLSRTPHSGKSDVLQSMKEVEHDSCGSIKLMNDSTLQEINCQIESHLADLRKEIETLQAAKGKTQKYVASLEKKVQELEHRLILDARTFNNRLEDEREAATKRLVEEQNKFQKEKLSLQRSLREERRKAPDPITQQEVLRLKQQVAEWDEKWRADRAKARGLESNLRIQLTNLKRENEKLKEENSKLRREKETALNTAKAKASSNTRVINSIAQQLGTNKIKVTKTREENLNQRGQSVSSGYNLKSLTQTKVCKPVATIENFPKIPHSSNEWSSDEEIDLGKESSGEEESDVCHTVGAELVKNKTHLNTVLISKENSAQRSHLSDQETIDLEEAQAKYDAMFGKESIDSPTTKPGSEVSERIKDSLHAKLPQETKCLSPNNNVTEKYVKSIHHPDGTIEQVKENGTRVVTCPDGTWRRHSSSGSVMTVPPSGWPIQISYFNGDQLEKLQDGRTRYFYAKTNTWQTSYPDGHEELQYASGQIERREPDGSVQVLLSDTSCSKVQGTDGISIEKLPNGDTVILLPTGERELHTKEYMKKEFLDGTVRYMYKNGSQETRYPSGRIRIKDQQGNLVKDTALSH